MCGAVPRFHDMPISRQSCGPLGKAPELEKDMFQETISRARALLKKSRKYAEKLRRESEGAEGGEIVEEVTRVRADSDLSSSSAGNRSRTASDDTGYRSASPADAHDKPPEHHDKKTESPGAHNDGGPDPPDGPDPLSGDTQEPGRPDRTPHAIKERLKV